MVRNTKTKVSTLKLNQSRNLKQELFFQLMHITEKNL